MIRASRDDLMAEFSNFVAAQTGLYFPSTSRGDLERAAAAAAVELGLPDSEAAIRWLLTPPVTNRHVQVLARYLTVGESYFFREKPALDALENRILPELVHARRATSRRLRIWSAACCTGEEPYTIAIILTRLLPDWKDWDITILATDINTDFLKQAASGLYRDWSFRATPASLRERYFTTVGGIGDPSQAQGGSGIGPAGDPIPTPANGYPRSPIPVRAIKPEIKHMVTFAPLNLATSGYPSLATNTTGMDIIVCRNALMYFTPECTARVIEGFHRALAAGGWLIVSPTEASPALFAQYDMVTAPGTVLYRKGACEEGRRQKAEGSSKGLPAAQRVQTHCDASLPADLRSHAPALPPPQVQIQKPSAVISDRGQALATDHGPPATAEAIHALYAQGRYTEAKEQSLALIERGAAQPRLYALLARIEANQGQLGAALEWCDRAISEDTLDPAHWYLRATILQEQGASTEAAKALRRVLYLDPSFVLAHFVLANLALRYGRKSEALKHFNVARSLLGHYQQDQVLSDVEDLTASQLGGMIDAMLDISEDTRL